MSFKAKPGFIIAQHLWRKDKDGNPMIHQFTKTAWDRLPPYTGDNPFEGSGGPVSQAGTVRIDRQGWEQISAESLITPKAAQEAQEAAEEVEPEEVPGEVPGEAEDKPRRGRRRRTSK